MRRPFPLLAALSVAVLAMTPARAAEPEPEPAAFDARDALAAGQAAIGRRIEAHVLTASDGRSIALSGFRGRPLVISPVYTSCFAVCPTTTRYLHRATDIASEVLGEQSFTVLTVGFDVANDTPARMADYARERGIRGPQWVFASGSPAEMRGLLDEIGFRYAPSAAGFDHMIQATVVDADGRVYRQVYGQQFEVPLLVDALKRLVTGQRMAEPGVGALVDSLRLVCTVFDPKSGRYRFDWSIVLSFAIGLSSSAAVAFFLWRAWREQPSRRSP